MTSIEEFFAHNVAFIVTTVGTIMSAFGLIQYRTGQLEQRTSDMIKTMESHIKDSDTRYVRIDVFNGLVSRLDRMEGKIDRLIERKAESSN